MGEIAPEQSWDFSRSAIYNSGTRADGDIQRVVSDNYYYVESATVSWLNNTLEERADNRSLGKAFSLEVPENGFEIIPIYQGVSGSTFDLHMEVDGEDKGAIWTKHEFLEVDNGTNGSTWTNVKNVKGNNSQTTIDHGDIRSKRLSFTGLTPGSTVNFYLKITAEGNTSSKIGVELRSDDGYMLALDMGNSRPTNIEDGKEVMVIGVEAKHRDTNLITKPDEPTDNDLNDLVFMVVGNPDLPRITQIDSKRYMVEDLGSTAESDIDFNDIVIDIESRQQGRMQYNSESQQSEFVPEGDPEQRARVMAMGGTLDFYFLLKNGTEYKNIYHKAAYNGYKEMLNTDVNEMSYSVPVEDWFPISGWDPTTNNVAFLVCRDRNLSLNDYFESTEHTDGIQTNNWISLDSMVPLNEKTDASGGHLVSGDGKLDLVNFPETGSTPFIVAFDIQKQWRDERHKICSHWLYGSVMADGKECKACDE